MMESKRIIKLDVVSEKSYFLRECEQSTKASLRVGSHRDISVIPEIYIATTDSLEDICGFNDYKTVICDCT